MIVAGFGFRTSASVESLRDAYERASGNRQISAIATLSDKADSRAIQDLTTVLGVDLLRVDMKDAMGQETLTEGAYSRASRKTGSVAESTALAAAGEGAVLIKARVVSSDRLATCALAQSRAEGDTE